MGMFDGQAADSSFSDEALFELAEEKQEEQQPQAETGETGPGAEQISRETEAEAAAPDGQPAEQQEPQQQEQEQRQPNEQDAEQTQLSEQVERLGKQMQEATARMTRACQEAAELRRQNQQLSQLLQNLQQPAQIAPKPQTAQSNEEFVQSFLQNPQAELARLAREQAAQLAGEQVKQVLQPVLQTLEHKSREEAWSKAWQEQAPAWPQLTEPSSQQELIQTMAQISADLGDAELWQKQPARLLQMAAVELFGLPKAVNGEAVRAANEAGRKAALAELTAKNSAKAGLAVSKGASRNEPPALTAEEQIAKEIEAAFGGRLI